MVEITKINPELSQKPLFETGANNSSPRSEAPEAQSSVDSFSPQAFISEGNLVSGPQRLGLRDLTDQELGGAYESLSPQQRRNFEDQGINETVRIARQTESGRIEARLSIVDVQNEISRREEVKRMEEASTPPKLSKSEKAKLERKRKTYEYYEAQRRKAAEYGERT